MRNVFRIYFRQTLVDVSNKDFLAKCIKNVLKSYNEECCLSVPVWDPQVAEERQAKVTRRAICLLYKEVS